MTPNSARLVSGVLILVASAAPLPAEVGDDRPVVRVGIVIDAPELTDRATSDGTRFGILAPIVTETLALTRQEFDVRFPESKRVFGDWTGEGIREALDRLLEDPDVDLVLALGPFSSAEAVSRKEYPKPVVAPFVIDIDSQEVPRDGGSSGVRNLNYVTLPLNIRDQIDRFREIVGFDRVHFVFDELILEILPEVPDNVLRMAGTLGVEGVLVPLADSARPAIEALPDDGQAVFLFPLPRFSPAEVRELLEIVNEKRIPSLSYLSDDLLDDGALISLAPQANLDRLTRRVAINIQRILLGEDAGTLPVVLDQEERLTINMETARRIGWYPNWQTLIRAELRNEKAEDVERSWSLDEVARRAVEANLALRSTQSAVAAGEYEVRGAEANLRPQVDLRTLGVAIDEDRAAASFGQQAERTVSGGLRLSQLLWSNRAFGNVGVQRRLQDAREAELEAEQLDVVLEATQAFLDVLRAQTVERIRRDNVRLTEDNLRLAERRRDLGVSGPAEVYRWQSRLATDRQDAIRAGQQVDIARAVLNGVLNRPLEEPFRAEVPDLLDPDLTTGEGRLQPYIDDPWSFEVFRAFVVEDGLSRAPELAGIDASIEAAKRSQRIARRSFWSPDVALFGELTERLSTGGAGSTFTAPLPGLAAPDDTDWSVGVQASFPLYSGGARRAELLRNDSIVRSLQIQKSAIREQLELRIRTSLFRVAASSPAIELSAEAAEAARRNLELVRDSYSQGVVTFLELLDAQNASLVADQVASNAVFDFLIDLMEVQRAAVNFDFFRSREQRDAWFDRVREHFERVGPPRAAAGR